MNQRKAKVPPAMTAQRAEISIWFWKKAMIEYAVKIVVKIPPESPSMPSMTLVEKTESMTSTKKGMNIQPRFMCTKKERGLRSLRV